VLGPEHPLTLALVNDLANALSDQGRYGEAIQLNEDALAIRLRLYGVDSPLTAASLYNLACLAALAGQPERALSLLNQAVEHGLSRKDDLRIETDSDLKSLHDDPRFKKIVAEAKQRATTVSE
jgi:tetratricopeptide (TPR) repeat protein